LKKPSEAEVDTIILQKHYSKPKENKDINGCYAVICYIVEFLFYPPIMGLLHFIYFAIQGVCLITIGIFLTILIPFFPIYLLCLACGEAGKRMGSLFLGLSLLSIILLFVGAITVIFSVFIALWQFFYVYYLVFSEGISPYYDFQWNWKQMTLLMGQSRELGVKYYHAYKKMLNIAE